jgi:hypothetical protein
VADPPTPPTDIDSDKAKRDQLVNQWFDAKAAIEKHEKRAKEAAEALIEELGVGGRHETLPGVGVRIQAPSRVFNVDRAREVLTADQFRMICELKPSSPRAQKMLPGLLVDQCKVTGANSSVHPL